MIRYIKSLFNKSTIKTAIHPECRRLIEHVKTIKGRKLYQFKDLLDMPQRRYNACTRFSTEFNMRIDSNILMTSIKDALKYSNEGNFTKVISILNILEAHTEMLISIDASYRLASCVYFWEDENLDEYDFEIGNEKIKLFKEIGLESFFLNKPMNNFLPQMDTSVQDLEACLGYERNLQNLLSKQLRERAEKNTKTT